MGILGLPSAAVFPFDGQAGPGVSFALRAQPLSRSTSRPSGCFLLGPLVSPGSALPVGGSDCRFCDCFSFGWAGSAGDFLCAQAQPLSWLRSRPSGCLLCTPLIFPGVFPACRRDRQLFSFSVVPGRWRRRIGRSRSFWSGSLLLRARAGEVGISPCSRGWVSVAGCGSCGPGGSYTGSRIPCSFCPSRGFQPSGRLCFCLLRAGTDSVAGLRPPRVGAIRRCFVALLFLLLLFLLSAGLAC